jgi:hypothetical protein
MGKWWNTASDDDIDQGLMLATEAAQEARATGNKKREAAFHEDINDGLDEKQRRGRGRR